jgi:hypothetical protein
MIIDGAIKRKVSNLYQKEPRRPKNHHHNFNLDLFFVGKFKTP